MDRARVHLPERTACPGLPVPIEPLDHSATQCLGADRGPVFYEAALRYAGSLWLQGLPAQSLLLINRALSCDLSGEEPVLKEWPLPYGAVVWILRHRREGEFIGNPRRHYQHLASRMAAGPRRELRIWRAWACWYLACRLLPYDQFPADERQIAEERLREPSCREIEAALARLGLPGEAELWRNALGDGDPGLAA